MRFLSLGFIPAMACILLAQQSETPPAAAERPQGWKKVEETSKAKDGFAVPVGTKIPLALISSVSTKSAMDGDRVYLETVFPILSNGRIVIPPGSFVSGTVTHSKRPGRVKGRAELYVRFDNLILPNGVTRDFRARVGSLDGRASEDLDRKEGSIRGEGNKGGDARTVGEAAAVGASVGAIGGSAASRAGMGAGIGAAAGATAGLVGVLVSRGPDAVLAKGSTLEMVLDRDLSFTESELDFSKVPSQRSGFSDGPGPLPGAHQQQRNTWPRRYPLQ